MRWAAAGTSLALSVLFVVVYSSTNWLASLRNDVGTWHFGWERHIPFVPWMFLPYLSIDLFFVAAPFLCRSRAELRQLAGRIALAIVVAGACFALVPLRLATERPPVEGVIGTLFAWFDGFDRPFNLVPSLHIALGAILAELYLRRTHGWLRVATALWFALVAASTLLVRQHHVVDVVGGAILATICFWLISPAPWRAATTGNRSAAAWYAVGAAASALGAFMLHEWGGWALWWPAFACAVVAMAYAGGRPASRSPGPAIYRKHDGGVPWATRVMLAPTLVGQWLSWRHYAHRSDAWSEIAGGLWFGRALLDAEAQRAIDGGVKAVLDLTAEFSRPRPFQGVTYLNIPLLDLTAPTPEQLERAVEFVEGNSAHGVVYVHCKAGYSRSAAVVGAVLLRRRTACDVGDAIERMRKARPGIVVRQETRAALESFRH